MSDSTKRQVNYYKTKYKEGAANRLRAIIKSYPKGVIPHHLYKVLEEVEATPAPQ